MGGYISIFIEKYEQFHKDAVYLNVCILLLLPNEEIL